MPAAFLVKPQGMQVVIRRDQPQPLAASRDSLVFDCIEQRGANPDALYHTIQRNDLTFVAVEMVGDKTYARSVLPCDETGQRVGRIDLAPRDNLDRSPLGGNKSRDPLSVI